MIIQFSRMSHKEIIGLRPGEPDARPASGFHRLKGDGMSSLREEAEYLRIAIAMGLLDTSAAVAWADRTIMALDVPPIEVIENISQVNRRPTR